MSTVNKPTLILSNDPKSASEGPIATSKMYSVDWLRAFGIFLVVLGHSKVDLIVVRKLIFAFHMPLFFFLSGMVLKPSRLKSTLAETARHLWATLIWPYAVFALIGFAAWFLVLRHTGQSPKAEPSPSQAALAIFYGSGSGDYTMQPIVLWFFPCLTVCHLMARISFSRPFYISLAIMLGLAVAGYAGRTMVLPWEIETACVAIGFMFLGFITAQRPQFHNGIQRLPWPFALVVFALSMMIAYFNDTVDLRSSQFGNPALYYLASIGSIFGLLGLALRLPSINWVRRISESTIVVFPLHHLGFTFLSGIYVVLLHLPLDFRTKPLVAIAGSMGIVAGLTWVAPPIKRLLGLGGRRAG